MKISSKIVKDAFEKRIVRYGAVAGGLMALVALGSWWSDWSGWKFPLMTRAEAEATEKAKAVKAAKHEKLDDDRFKASDKRFEAVLKALEIADAERKRLDVQGTGNALDRKIDQLYRARREQRWYTNKRQPAPEALDREIKQKTRSIRKLEDKLERLEAR